MELIKRIGIWVILTIALSLFVVAASRTSFVDNYYSNHSLYDIANISVRDMINISGIGWIGQSKIATLADLTGGNVTVSSIFRVQNKQGVAVPPLTAMHFSGWNVGQNAAEVQYALSTDKLKHAECITSETIANNAFGSCVAHGIINNVDTSMYTEDVILHLNKTDGTLTEDQPVKVDCLQEIGEVQRSHASQGVFYANVPPGCEEVPSFVNVTGNLTVGDYVFFVDETAGRVGIGMTEPSEKLDVAGAIKASGTIYGNRADRFAFYALTGGIYASGLVDNYFAGNVGIGTATPAQTLTLLGTLNVTADSTAGPNLFVASSGNVGIGTATPNYKLDVYGTINASAINAKVGWTNLTNYPSACPSGSFVSTLGDSVTCTTTPDLYMQDTGDNISGNYNHTVGNWSMAENGTDCYGWNCEGQIYYNGSSLVIKVT